MGGVGSGGARPGAGRPRKVGTVEIRPQGRVLTHPSAPATPTEPVVLDESMAPNELTLEQRIVWMDLAKLALSKGKTLADVQGYPFRLLCCNVALERRYAASVMDAGSANHRGMIQAIDKELLRFGLVDFGKAPEKKKPAANPFAALAVK